MNPRSTPPRRLGLAALVTLLVACTTEPERRTEEPAQTEDAIVSDARSATPISGAGLSFQRASAASPGLAASLAETELVYIGLSPGQVPTGVTASIRNKRLDGDLYVTIRDGGFDPVPIPAVAGDSVIVNVRLADGALLSFRTMVPTKRRPTVVRTSLPRGRTGVPLNMHIRVVFSEPVDPATVTSSTVRVTRGGRAIPGAVRLIDGAGLVAAFIPDGPFAPNADHRLEITTGVRDEQGEPLDRLTPVDFTTGTTLVGPPAFIRVSPDTVEMTSLTYQLSATVMDQSANELAEEPLTWSVADGAGITVSATGLVTAFAEGDFRVWASLRDDPAVLGGTTVKVRSKDPPVTFTIAPAPGLVALEDTLALTAVLRDEAGRALDRQVTWSSSDPAVASVESRWQGDRSATLITRRTGSVTITATSGTRTATSVVNVTPPRTVASIALATEPVAVLASTPTRIDRILRDADGREIFVRQLSWTPDDPTIAAVDAHGVVTGLRAGSTSVRAEIDGASARLTVVVSTIDFTAVVAGSSYSCALTAAGAAHCSGRIFGDGGFLSSEVPVAIAGDVVFESLSAGSLHVCGLTSAGLAHCWGSNFLGALGNSVTTFSARPVPVDGGHVFSTLTTGDAHACGLTADGVAYCWGSNTDGELGNGSFGSSAWSATPVRVGGDHRFVEVAAGFRKTCGLKADATAWCWGRNANGELGNGSAEVRSTVPTLVMNAPSFSALGSGATASHTCALGPTGAAHCWGNNSVGQLGTMTGLGTVNTVRTPAAVEGGQTFAIVSSGSAHSCGVATGGAAFCWGSNADGRLGTGKGGVGPPNPFDLQPAPVAVVGGIRFASLSVGGGHTCGMSTDGIAYCWGAGSQGQLGRGAKTSSNIPQKVGGQP